MQTQFLESLQRFPLPQSSMNSLLQKWVEINSGSENIYGLKAMSEQLQFAFACLGCKINAIPLPPRQTMDSSGNLIDLPVGHALHMTKRPQLKQRVFLSGHMDTVYPSHSPFQHCEMLSSNKMRGPGSADMKGGLVILLHALKIFESTPWSQTLGWDLLITPDEEVGSKSSEKLIIEVASSCQSALIFEPTFSDGHLVSSRKGSMNYSFVCHGKAAHAGRDFHLGRNAITALAGFVTASDALNNHLKGTTVNIAKIEGGGPANVVPHLASCKLNVRSESLEELTSIDRALHEIADVAGQADGIQVKLFQENFRSPKPFDGKTEKLFQMLNRCGNAMAMDIQWRPSGGVCDGNIVSMAGVPCIDTLGAVGGNIHTYDEYVDLDSLSQRSRLTALLLTQLAMQPMNTRTIEPSDE